MYKVYINNPPEIIDLLREYYKKHGSAESIMQSDNGQIEGLELLCKISEIIDIEYQIL